jgi:RNA polymerase sigma factor (sigma-70 family)
MSGNGSIDARELLVRQALEEFESPLIGYAASILRDADRARDVVQDTFIKLFEQEPDSVSTALKAWLFTVCRNRCFDVLRKEKRMTNMEDEQIERIHDPADDPAEAVARSDQHSEVLRFLERLPENQREVIRLKFQGEMSYKEISEVTQLSVSNVGFLIHAGLKRLRGLLSHQMV